MSARTSLFLGILAGLLMLAGCVGTLYWLLLPEHFPVNRVELKGDLKHTTKREIEAALPRESANGAVNFFAADLAALRAGVERLPWVRRVSARRVWPDRIELHVDEHAALARWGDDRLVNTYGETFSAKTTDKLPAFVAPPGTSAEVTRRYRRFVEIVAPLNTSVERVVLTHRHAWQLRLANGLHLMLGRDADQAEVRLARFVEAHPATVARTGKKYEYVDLRYPNGFALRVPDRSG
jgi:cell division protein FtsQ